MPDPYLFQAETMASCGRYRFRPEERISKDKEIQRILISGDRAVSQALTLFYLERDKVAVEPILQEKKERISTCRFAIRVEKNFGNSVKRNRVKRILREIFRKEKWQLKPYTDLLLLLKPQSHLKEIQYENLRKEFIALCQQAGIWSAG